MLPLPFGSMNMLALPGSRLAGADRVRYALL
jgi:hypothetical protein